MWCKPRQTTNIMARRGSVRIVGILGCIAWLAAWAGHSGAIVSERHLRGVKALLCELEAASGGAAPARFRLAVNSKERTLRLESGGAPFPYEEISDTALRFALSLPAASELTCELELPAGALSCASAVSSASPRLGLCLPAP
jgi:hypothetical protein